MHVALCDDGRHDKFPGFFDFPAIVLSAHDVGQGQPSGGEPATGTQKVPSCRRERKGSTLCQLGMMEGSPEH